jgi:amino acid permease
MERLFKRKLFVLSLVAIIIIGATGYMVFGRNSDKAINKNLFNVVAEIEKNAHE